MYIVLRTVSFCGYDVFETWSVAEKKLPANERFMSDEIKFFYLIIEQDNLARLY